MSEDDIRSLYDEHIEIGLVAMQVRSIAHRMLVGLYSGDVENIHSNIYIAKVVYRNETSNLVKSYNRHCVITTKKVLWSVLGTKDDSAIEKYAYALSMSSATLCAEISESFARLEKHSRLLLRRMEENGVENNLIGYIARDILREIKASRETLSGRVYKRVLSVFLSRR